MSMIKFHHFRNRLGSIKLLSVFLLQLIFLTGCFDTQEPVTSIESPTGIGGRASSIMIPPKVEGVKKSGYYANQPITYTEVNGKAYFQGDIILDDSLLSDKLLAKGAALGYDHISNMKRWPLNQVFYSIHRDVPNKERIYNAINTWRQSTGIQFYPSTSADPNWILFVRSTNRCASYLGMKGGEQTIELMDEGCDEHAVVHEIGHALGLYHEQMRSDRDTYLNINWNNIDPSYLDQYTITSLDFSFNWGALDYNSVMIYDSYWCAINTDIPVMTRKNGTVFSPSLIPTATDIAAIRRMYPHYHHPKGGFPLGRDIAVGANGAAFMITNTSAGSGNYTILRWNASQDQWVGFSGSGVSIAVTPSGNPWVTMANGTVRRWTGSSWTTVGSMSGAKDIGIGSNGSVFILSSAVMNGYNYSVYQWTGSTWSRMSTGGGLRLSVDNNGRPWTANHSHQLHRWSGSSWILAGSATDDVGIGADGVVYVTDWGKVKRKVGSASQNNSESDRKFFYMNNPTWSIYDPLESPARIAGGPNGTFLVLTRTSPWEPEVNYGRAFFGNQN